MVILGIETSCDETSAAILEKHDNQITLKSNIVASSLAIHQQTGGIIPENAAREQIKYILPVIQEALDAAKMQISHINAIAVTYGPGLIGSLLVGVETAKTLAYATGKPIIPVNHMLGHVYANWITSHPVISRSNATRDPEEISHSVRNDRNIEFPALALVVSGGHTDLVFFENHHNYRILGGTRDDAAGEAFDKIARLIGLSYPGGPIIEEKAKKGDPKRFTFPRPLVGSGDYDFSFSGLKTAVLREVQNLKTLDDQTVCDLARATQDAIISVLVKKTLKAAIEYDVKSILLSGGVAANETLQQAFIQNTKYQIPDTKFFAPAKNLCTDNGAMIAAAAFYQYNPLPWQEITADPQLYFE